MGLRVAVVVLALRTAAFAQSVGMGEPVQPAPSVVTTPASSDAALDYRTGKTIRNIGIGMSAVGIVLPAVSAYYAFRRGLFPCGIGPCSPQEQADIDRDDRLARDWLIGAAVLTGVGVTVGVIGEYRMQSAQRARLRLTPVVSPVRGGAVAGIQVMAF